MFLSKHFYSFLLFLVPILPVTNEEGEFIDWSKNRRLLWSDFEGPVNKKSDAAASTSTYLGLEYNVRNTSFSYRIACRFSKTKSWGFVKNEWILKHEQGHFDITEIFARLLNKAISDYKFNRNTYKKDVDGIYKSYIKQKEDFQNLYDTQTDYSRKREQQEEWLIKIESLLDETKDFARYN